MTMIKFIAKFLLHILCVIVFFLTIPLVVLQVLWTVVAFCFGYDSLPDPISFIIVDYINDKIDKI